MCGGSARCICSSFLLWVRCHGVGRGTPHLYWLLCRHVNVLWYSSLGLDACFLSDTAEAVQLSSTSLPRHRVEYPFLVCPPCSHQCRKGDSWDQMYERIP